MSVAVGSGEKYALAVSPDEQWLVVGRYGREGVWELLLNCTDDLTFEIYFSAFVFYFFIPVPVPVLMNMIL